MLALCAIGLVAASSPALRLRGGAGVQQLITPSGELIRTDLSALGSSQGLSVVASVGGKLRGRRLLNDLFGTSFPVELPTTDATAGTGAGG